LLENIISVQGPKGELTQVVHPQVKVILKDKEIEVAVKNSENKNERALWGLFNALIFNMVKGVTEGFSKSLEINGVGYRFEIKGKQLVLHVGFSHLVELDLPAGVEASVEGNVLTITGFDKQVVGAFAAKVREVRKPEPYKGKGIKYTDEQIIRKAGKQAKTAE